MRNFKELKIWQKGFEIAVKSYKLTSRFPKEEKFGITSQITRAAVSIPSNIAEGSSR
jgi:four helix bundle protein